MPRQARNTIGDFRLTEDASHQDIVNAVESSKLAVTDKLESLEAKLERIDREQELILGEEVEEV